MTETKRRAAVQRIHDENKAELTPKFRQVIAGLLSRIFAKHVWMYVYELTQNAIDAGATRVNWRLESSRLIFQHNGPEALEERHVKALSDISGSTKGLSAVGFMGVGFKSIYKRYRAVRVNGFGWCFRYDIKTNERIPVPLCQDRCRLRL